MQYLSGTGCKSFSFVWRFDEHRLLSREIVGIMVSFERFLVDAEEKGNPFVLSLLEKQHFRLKLVFDRHIVS